MATLPLKLSNLLPDFSQLQRSRDERDDKVPTSFMGRGEMLSLLKLSFYEPLENACRRSSSWPKAIRNWSLLALLCPAPSGSFWRASSYLSFPPLPTTAHTVNFSHLKAAQSSNPTRPAGLCCSPEQMQSLNRYDLYDADRPVYCPLLGLCETHLMKCKAVGGFRCSWLLGHKDQKVPAFGRR